VVLPCNLLERISKMSIYEISYSNELKLFNGDPVILYLICVPVIIQGAREARRGEACTGNFLISCSFVNL